MYYLTKVHLQPQKFKQHVGIIYGGKLKGPSLMKVSYSVQKLAGAVHTH
jgi:hypothetical protein